MKTPWHLWFVGILSLLWNGGALYDFAMTMTQNPGYLARFTPEQRDYFIGFPAWVQIAWGIASVLSVLGSILLLLRLGLAEPVFGIAFVAMIVTAVHNFALADTRMDQVVGPLAAVFSIVIVVVGLLLWYYARRMRLRGVLR